MLKDVSDQSLNAASAEAIASSTSAAVQQGTSAITSPVLESVTGIHFSVFDSLHSPLTQYFFLKMLIAQTPSESYIDAVIAFFRSRASPSRRCPRP